MTMNGSTHNSCFKTRRSINFCLSKEVPSMPDSAMEYLSALRYEMMLWVCKAEGGHRDEWGARRRWGSLRVIATFVMGWVLTAKASVGVT